MIIRKMNDELIRINQLSNIKSISFNDLYQERNDKFLVLPGFIILSDKTGFMYLTSRDEYFEDFVRKIREVYLEEKDKVYEDGILGEKKLEIDPFTESILLNGNVENTSELYSFYKDKNTYKESLLFEEDKLSSFKGIIIHHLKETMKLFSKTITKIKLSTGSNGIYYLTAEINNTPVLLPIYFERKDENTYTVKIGNLFDSSIPLNMEILFTSNGISVSNTISEYGFSDYTKYEFTSNKGTSEREVSIRGELKYLKKEELPIKTPKEHFLVNLDNKEEVKTWYKLPWNAYEGVTITDKCIEDDGTLSDNDGNNRMASTRLTYLALEDEDFFLRDVVSKRYRKKEQLPNNNIELVLDNLEKQIIGLRQKDGYIIETTFMGNAVTGFYKTNLLGNSIYHISRAKNITELISLPLEPLGREDGLEEKVDLIDIKKYIK